MKFWHFCEQSLHTAWAEIDGPTKVTVPNSYCDPKLAHEFYNRYLDEWMVADDLGYDIMVNEHHASANCMSVSCTLTLAILARQTKKARLLALGIPIANRPDPYRVAEEIAMIDVISGGRLEVGLVKASPFELVLSNQSPARLMERYWEGHDFIVKALTHVGAPFSWEGEFYQYRNVNLWPRPLQQPLPPMWMTCSSEKNARVAARLGYVCATFFNGPKTKQLFDSYKDEYLKVHGKPAPADRLGYLALSVCGHNDAQVQERYAKVKTYLDAQPRTPKGWINPPGYESVELNAGALKSGKKGRINFGLPENPTVQEMAEGGIFFAGTPDQIYHQYKNFHDKVGGYGQVLMLGQAGYLTHEETVDSMTLFAKEVAPRLREATKNGVSEAASAAA